MARECPKCKGDGQMMCERCEGSGVTGSSLQHLTFTDKCLLCYGNGTVECDRCNGSGGI